MLRWVSEETSLFVFIEACKWSSRRASTPERLGFMNEKPTVEEEERPSCMGGDFPRHRTLVSVAVYAIRGYAHACTDSHSVFLLNFEETGTHSRIGLDVECSLPIFPSGYGTVLLQYVFRKC